MRADASGYRLNEDDAAVVKAMIERGDRQHDIASWFGVNGGRIAEVATGARFPDVRPSTELLPPPGPYRSGRSVEVTRTKLTEIKHALQTLLQQIDEQLAGLDPE